MADLSPPRMLRVFGKREMEIAAIRILDTQWDHPYIPVNEQIFQGDAMALEGFALLKEHGWIFKSNVPTCTFWKKVHGR